VSCEPDTPIALAPYSPRRVSDTMNLVGGALAKPVVLKNIACGTQVSVRPHQRAGGTNVRPRPAGDFARCGLARRLSSRLSARHYNTFPHLRQ